MIGQIVIALYVLMAFVMVGVLVMRERERGWTVPEERPDWWPRNKREGK